MLSCEKVIRAMAHYYPYHAKFSMVCLLIHPHCCVTRVLLYIGLVDSVQTAQDRTSCRVPSIPVQLPYWKSIYSHFIWRELGKICG